MRHPNTSFAKAIALFVKVHYAEKVFRTKDVEKNFNVAKSTAIKHLNRLVEAGVLQKVSLIGGTHYKLIEKNEETYVLPVHPNLAPLYLKGKSLVEAKEKSKEIYKDLVAKDNLNPHSVYSIIRFYRCFSELPNCFEPNELSLRDVLNLPQTLSTACAFASVFLGLKNNSMRKKWVEHYLSSTTGKRQPLNIFELDNIKYNFWEKKQDA